MPTYTYFEQLKDGRSTDGENGLVYTRVFQVTASERGVHPANIVAWAYYQRDTDGLDYGTTQTVGATTYRLPVRRDGDNGFYCQSVDCVLLDGSGDTFTYTATFSENELAELPEDDEPDIEWGGEDSVEDVFEDLDGTPVRNAVGDYFDQQPQREKGVVSCTITYNIETNPATLIATYSHTINSSAFHSSGTKMAKIGRMRASKQREGQTTYWRLTVPMSFKVNGETWDSKPIDIGYRYKPSSGSALTDLKSDKDVNQNPIPVFLAANGTKTGTAVVANGGAGFKLYNAVSWASLSLPNPFA